jgi:hypothetical protein
MPPLSGKKRAGLPNSAFAYIDSRGRRRLPINDKAHVRNALSRFNQVAFENDAARERARKRLLNAAKKYGIVPIGFITGQLQSERKHATAGRIVIELGRNGAPGELQQRLRSVLRDPTLAVPALVGGIRGVSGRHGKTGPAARRRGRARGDVSRADGPAHDCPCT